MWDEDKVKTTERMRLQVLSMDEGLERTETKETMSPAILIEASRRVDWRFLLPDPSLGRVVGVAPLEKTLATSLSLFSESLTVAETGQNGTFDVDPFDLAVARDPSRTTLTRMAGWVRPGGFLYIEAHGLVASLRSLGSPGRPSGFGFKKNSLWRPAAYADALVGLGCTEVQTYWHWPDFETCKMIIPLDNPVAVRHALDRGGRSLKARLRAGVGRWLHWSGLLTFTIPCFSVLARRSGS